MGIPNLAHAIIAFSSGYIVLTMVLLGITPYVGIPFAAVYGGVISFLLYRFLAFLRRRNVSIVGLMISTLVFQFLIYGCMNIYAEYIAYSLHAFTFSFILNEADFTFKGLPGVLFISVITATSLATLFHLILTRTKMGIAMRAIMENFSLASVDGINVDYVLSISWLLVGAVAGISGALFPLWFSVDPWVSTVMLTSIFAASVVGGIRSVYGSLVGAVIVAVSEILGTFALSKTFGAFMWSYRAAAPIILTCIVLLVMPQGLAGYFERFRERRKAL